MANAYTNGLLRHLNPAVLQRLYLKAVLLPLRREIEFPGRKILYLIFPESGVASMTTTFEDGFEAEVAFLGRESVLGISALMGTTRSLNRVYMQLPGFGYAVPIQTALAEFHRGEEFHDLILRFFQAQFIQTAQTAGCNARHTIDRRLARWLLLCDDRVDGGRISLSQEFLAEMLGVRRSGVSIATAKFQELGLIRCGHGKIDILDRAGLEEHSCECYEVVRRHLESYAETGSADETIALARARALESVKGVNPAAAATSAPAPELL